MSIQESKPTSAGSKNSTFIPPEIKKDKSIPGSTSKKPDGAKKKVNEKNINIIDNWNPTQADYTSIAPHIQFIHQSLMDLATGIEKIGVVNNKIEMVNDHLTNTNLSLTNIESRLIKIENDHKSDICTRENFLVKTEKNDCSFKDMQELLIKLEKRLDKIENGQISIENGQISIEKRLDKIENEQISIGECLDNLEDGQTKLGDGQSFVGECFYKLEDCMSKLENNQSYVRESLVKIHSGQTKLKNGHVYIGECLLKLEEGQSKLEDGQSKLEDGQSKLEDGQSSIGECLYKLESNATRLENNQISICANLNTIGDRTFIEEHLANIEDRQISIENHLNKLEKDQYSIFECLYKVEDCMNKSVTEPEQTSIEETFEDRILSKLKTVQTSIKEQLGALSKLEGGLSRLEYGQTFIKEQLVTLDEYQSSLNKCQKSIVDYIFKSEDAFTSKLEANNSSSLKDAIDITDGLLKITERIQKMEDILKNEIKDVKIELSTTFETESEVCRNIYISEVINQVNAIKGKGVNVKYIGNKEPQISTSRMSSMFPLFAGDPAVKISSGVTVTPKKDE